MNSAWILQHEHELNGQDEVKFIGAYSSRATAEAAIARLREQPGFCDHPDGFTIGEYPLDRDHWVEGFVTQETSRYIAVIVMRADVAATDSIEPLYDVQYRLIWADDDEEAYRIALKLGAAEQCEYENEDGQGVAWQFVGLHDLEEVNTRGQGVEVYSERRRGNPPRIAEKQQLSVFWNRDNADRTAREILNDE